MAALHRSPLKRCEQLIRATVGARRLYEVFVDFTEMAALALQNRMPHPRHQEYESRYAALRDRYPPNMQKNFPMMMAALAEAMWDRPGDHLGALYMGLELGNPHTSQFFTPYEISRLMAGVQFHDLDASKIESLGGFITFLEPACGAGGMIIAAAELMRERGLDPCRHMHATAVDIDPTACHMAYVQFTLMGLPAIVARGNSLLATADTLWLTDAHVSGGWSRKLRERETAGPVDPAPDDAALGVAMAAPSLSTAGSETEAMQP